MIEIKGIKIKFKWWQWLLLILGCYAIATGKLEIVTGLLESWHG